MRSEFARTASPYSAHDGLTTSSNRPWWEGVAERPSHTLPKNVNSHFNGDSRVGLLNAKSEDGVSVYRVWGGHSAVEWKMFVLPVVEHLGGGD